MCVEGRCVCVEGRRACACVDNQAEQPRLSNNEDRKKQKEEAEKQTKMQDDDEQEAKSAEIRRVQRVEEKKKEHKNPSLLALASPGASLSSHGTSRGRAMRSGRPSAATRARASRTKCRSTVSNTWQGWV